MRGGVCYSSQSQNRLWGFTDKKNHPCFHPSCCTSGVTTKHSSLFPQHKAVELPDYLEALAGREKRNHPLVLDLNAVPPKFPSRVTFQSMKKKEGATGNTRPRPAGPGGLSLLPPPPGGKSSSPAFPSGEQPSSSLSAPVRLPGTPITGPCHVEMLTKLFRFSFIHRGLFGKALTACLDAAVELLLQEELVSVPRLRGAAEARCEGVITTLFSLPLRSQDLIQLPDAP